MIRTLSPASSNTSCSSNEHRPPSPSTRPRRFTLNSIATRLSDSKKNFLEQIPHHQQQLTSFRKRARSFLSSSLIDHLSEFNSSSSSDRRNSSTGVYKSRINFIFSKLYKKKTNKLFIKIYLFRSSVSMKFTDELILHIQMIKILVFHLLNFFSNQHLSMKNNPNKYIQ